MAQTELEKKLSAVYGRGGLLPFLQACKEVITTSKYRGVEVSPQDRGDICELVLQRVTQTYLELSGKEGKYFRSVVLRDLRNPKGGRVLELDGIFVTPYFILSAECKSYRGNMLLEGQGTLHSKDGRSVDLYGQSVAHKSVLDQYGKELCASNRAGPHLPIYYCGFLYALSEVQDLRLPRAKSDFAILTQSDIVRVYNNLYKKYTTAVFDYERACAVFGKCSRSRNLHGEHAAYVGYERRK